MTGTMQNDEFSSLDHGLQDWPQISIPIGLKIFGIAASLLGLLILIAYNSHQRLRQLQREVFDLSEYIIPITNRVDEVDTQALEQEVHLERILKLYEEKSLDVDRIVQEHQHFEQRGHQVDVDIEAAIALSREAIDRAVIQANREELKWLEPQLEKIEQEHQDFHDHAVNLLQRLEFGERGGLLYGLELRIEVEEDHLNQEIEAILNELGSHTINMAQLSERHQREVLRNGLLITGGAVALGMVYASGVTLSIVRPLRHLTHQVQRLRHGKTVEPLVVRSNDEVGLLNATFNHMLGELAHKEKLKELFGKYVDPRVVAQHEQRGKALQTTGEKQIVTVLMSDIDGFQPISNRLAPEKQLEVINLYLGLLSTSVAEQQGFTEFVDTMIKGFWAPPFVDETVHAHCACEAALSQISKLQELRRQLKQAANTVSDLSEVTLHIGLATGPLILANMGPEWATSYTVLGDTVNAAARLKGVAKQFGVPILLLEETQQQIQPTMATREIGLVQVVGKNETLRVFELLGRHGQLSVEQVKWNETFSQGLAAYRQQDWEQAEEKFAACLKVSPQDKPAQKYLQASLELRDQALPPDWNGVWRLTQK